MERKEESDEKVEEKEVLNAENIEHDIEVGDNEKQVEKESM